jgi:hypothetical protein
MWRKILLLISLFSSSFAVRIIFWIFGFSSYTGWAIYDVGYYVDNSERLIISLFQKDFTIVRDLLFHPLFGFYTTGLSTLIFGELTDKYQAGLLSPIFFSSLTCSVVYLIGEKIGGSKMGFIAWLLASFDPYSIQFSTTFLDMPATFFSTLFMYLLIKYVSSTNWERFVLLGIVAGLAFSSKHIVIPLVGLLILLHIKKIKDCIIITTVAIISYLFVNFPKFLSLENVKLMLNANIQGGGIGIPAIIYGPIEIGKPYTYPWYILTYLGLGYTGPNVAPYITPAICLIFYCFHTLTKRKNNAINNNIYYLTISWAACSLIPVIFLPRNYWTTLPLGEGTIVKSDVLIKFFFPYYYVVSIPAFSVFVAYLIMMNRCIQKFVMNFSIGRLFLRFSDTLIFIFLILSPLGFTANIFFPFWDFMFALIINIEKTEPTLRYIALESWLATMLILLATILIVTYYTLKSRTNRIDKRLSLR